MTGRKFSAGSGYRYGFNGKEKDNEIKGNSNALDFGARIYDSRLCRWLSVDPLQNKYPSSSPYVFSLNNPIYYIDIDGRDVKPSPGFLASKYNTIYEALKNSSSTFTEILKPYNENNKLNLILDINPAKLKPGDFARTYSAGSKYSIRTIGKKKEKFAFQWTSDASMNYSNDLLSKVQTLESNGKTYQRNIEHSDFFIASQMIHESIHALVDADAGKIMNGGGVADPNHTLLNNHRDMFIKALTEYVEKQKLSYKKEDIEDMAWHSTEASDQFNKHFDEVSKLNGTTKKEEIDKWKERIIKLGWKIGEAKEVEKKAEEIKEDKKDGDG